MSQEIDVGVDCRKTYLPSKRKIRIYPKSKVIRPGQLLLLDAQHVPFACDPMCYTWELVGGGGTLSPLKGTHTNYRAPDIDTNNNCRFSATINLYLASEHLDTAVYTINTFDDERVAFDLITLEQTIQDLPSTTTWPPPGKPKPPADATTNRLRMYTWANQYTCKGKLINKYAWSTRTFLWYFNIRKGQWFLFYGPTNDYFVSIPQMMAHYGNIAKHREGDVLDKRSSHAKRRGCCPLKLAELGIEYPDESFPGF